MHELVCSLLVCQSHESQQVTDIAVGKSAFAAYGQHVCEPFLCQLVSRGAVFADEVLAAGFVLGESGLLSALANVAVE